CDSTNPRRCNLKTPSRFVLLLAIATLVPVIWACGPYFDPWLLSGQVEFLRSPRAGFEKELLRIDAATSFRANLATNGFADQTLRAELLDLDNALDDGKRDETERAELLAK